MDSAASAPSDRSHPLFARLYGPLRRGLDRSGFDRRRSDLLAGVSGVVVDVGAGDGANFAHFGPGVTEVVAVEPEPTLRGAATRAAERAPVKVKLVPGTAERLPLADASADAVVFTLVLCSVEDVGVALSEAFRVLRSGGRVLLSEHVRAPDRNWARIQHALDVTVWPRVAGGCHLGRDPVEVLRSTGFEILELERYLLPRRRSPISFHVSLKAQKP